MAPLRKGHLYSARLTLALSNVCVLPSWALARGPAGPGARWSPAPAIRSKWIVDKKNIPMSAHPRRDAILSLFSQVSATDTSSFEALRPFYADDVHFQDPIQEVHGFEAFLALNLRLARRSRELAFLIDRVTGDDDEMFITWRMRLRPWIGPLFELDGVSHLRAEGGKIRHHRDYWDLGEMFASALPGGLALLRLLRRPLA